jgi:hypothetical protein
VTSLGRSILPRLHADLLAAAPIRLPVPGFLLGEPTSATVEMAVRDFLADCVEQFLSTEPAPPPPARPELVYSVYLPTFASLGGRVGTLLSFLPFLSFLRRELAVDTVISLPLGTIGRAQRKGLRGSPFAVSDPFAIDERYADPVLPHWNAHDLYLAVIEAARRLGVRFGSIIPLATLSIDSPLQRTSPDITYWWRAGVGELLVATDDGAVPKISPQDRNRFTAPPSSGSVTSETGALIARSDGHLLTPANAMPDVTVDMNATYTWEDVVSVNYTALPYPVPHGEHRLAPPDRTRSAWRIMPEAIAWRLRHGERALVIDVQSSVPAEVLDRGLVLARQDRPLSSPPCCEVAERGSDGPVWVASEELWSFTAARPAEAIVGPFIYCAVPYARDTPRLVESLAHHLDLLAATEAPLPFFAGAGSHDTVPHDVAVVRPLLLFLWLLPGAIPFLFSGVEHGLSVPTNREFGFSRAEQDALSYERLQMFSPTPLDWDALDWAQSQQLGLVKLLRAVRDSVADCLAGSNRPHRLPTPGSAVAYRVSGPHQRKLTVVANFGAEPARQVLVDALPGGTIAWAGGGPPARNPGGTVDLPPLSAFACLPSRPPGPAQVVGAGLADW